MAKVRISTTSTFAPKRPAMTTAIDSDAGVEQSPVAPARREWMRWLGLLVRLTLGVVAGWAGLAKLVDLPTAVRAVRAYQLLPEAIVPAVGYALPVEIGRASCRERVYVRGVVVGFYGEVGGSCGVASGVDAHA